MEFVASFLSGELCCNGFFHPLSASRALSGAWGEDARGVGTIPRQHQAEVRAAWARMGVCECARVLSPPARAEAPWSWCHVPVHSL